jgi:hypothetical protein
MSEARRGSAGVWIGGLALLFLAGAGAAAAGTDWGRAHVPRGETSWFAGSPLLPGVYFLDDRRWWDKGPWDTVVVVGAGGEQTIRESTRWERVVWRLENPCGWWRSWRP